VVRFEKCVYKNAIKHEKRMCPNPKGTPLHERRYPPRIPSLMECRINPKNKLIFDWALNIILHAFNIAKSLL
jgi:hypothetical protein